MDESWRMRMGLNNLPRRRSTEETSSDRLMMMAATMRRNNNYNNSETSSSSTTTTTTSLDPENFSDVFGGPPRSIISRQFSSGDLITGNLKTNYEEIFRSSDYTSQARNGKNKILPSKKKKIDNGFYDDIFGSDDEGNRRSNKWKSSSEHSINNNNKKKNLESSSSSVLSWEGGLSPLRPSIAEDDVFFDTFTSKLRPVNIPGRRPHTSSAHVLEQQHKKGPASDYPWINNHRENNSNQHDFVMDIGNSDHNHNRKNSSSRFAFSHHSISSPETISIEPNSYRSSSFASNNNISKENGGNPGESPCSVGSLQREYYPTFNQAVLKTTNRRHYHQDYRMSPEEEEEDHEELMRSSYVIELTSDNNREKTRINKRESVGIDEAIAWAKEKFQSQCVEIIEEITNHQQQQQQLQQQIRQKEDNRFLTRENNGIRKVKL